MSEELALGQREVVEGIEFTPEELQLMTDNNVEPEAVKMFVATSGVQTINAAIAGVHELEAGKGQERNEPFTPPADAQE